MSASKESKSPEVKQEGKEETKEISPLQALYSNIQLIHRGITEKDKGVFWRVLRGSSRVRKGSSSQLRSAIEKIFPEQWEYKDFFFSLLDQIDDSRVSPLFRSRLFFVLLLSHLLYLQRIKICPTEKITFLRELRLFILKQKHTLDC